MQRLEGKVVLVTGAGAGIGQCICWRFAEEGATLIATDRDATTLEATAAGVRERGGSVHTAVVDVTRDADCKAAVDLARKQAGALHALCNVAGIVDGGTLLEASEDSWQRSHDINVRGTWYMSRAAVPLLLESGGGSIVNIASVAGIFGVKSRGVYSTTKAGVVGLTKSLAMDFIDQGLRANAICPGTVETPSLHDRINQAPDPKQALKDFIARQPMGRLGRPEEIAALAAYLACDESQYMTGQTLIIDGGMTL